MPGGVPLPHCSLDRDRDPGRVSLLVHERGAEGALGLELIVSPAPQPEVLQVRSTAARDRLDMIELEPGAFAAAAAGVADERALTLIALLHRTLDRVRDMAWVRARMPGLSARPVGRGVLALLQLLDQRIQGPIEHRRDVARRDPVG